MPDTDLAHCIAATGVAETDEQWTALTLYCLEPYAQVDLMRRLSDRTDPLTPTGLTVLMHRLIKQALGMDMFAAGNLCAQFVAGWFPFHAWSAQHGLVTQNVPLHLILPSVYGWLLSSRTEQKDIDKLNRRTFGTTNPWGG